MNLVVDNETYMKIGPVFTIEFIKNIARALETTGFNLDTQNPSDQYVDLILNTCFNIFVQIEGPNRVTVDNTDYFAHLTFSTDRKRPEIALMADTRSILHGEALTEELVRKALKEL
ncbi:MAG: hypothetical protein AAFN16_00610 [Pseudomonadota bacterium]